jgi:RNA polymerase sigma-70 factor (ECF subfamily)
VAADAAMDRYAEGDTVAFGELYDALAPRWTLFFLRKLGCRELSADLLQETMLRIHDARGRFVRGSRVAPWAFTIARHLMLDRARRQQRERLTADGDLDARPSNDQPAVEDALADARNLRALKNAISVLPQGQRDAYELVYYAGMTHAEAAEALAVTSAAVKLRVQRATETLRNSCRTESSES